ncbi:phage terminase small subunit P27 family, partial [Morganella morganii]|nr:phage terminase small subunit P27 family [Morganella morganii]EGT3632579.1 phage terminase small subunit P27 family [Morganella morganii]
LIEAYTEYRQHCDTLDEQGYTYTTESEGGTLIKAHPVAAMKADAWKRIRAMLGEFGMTPASRSKVTINTPAEEDPFEAFMKKRK